jgi:hypothetical protein
MSDLDLDEDDEPPIPYGNRLVSCCPELQSLQLQAWQCSADLLVPLQGLGSLQNLGVSLSVASDLQLVCHLTHLRQLTVQDSVPSCRKDSFEYLKLTQLQHLTRLKHQRWHGVDWELACQVRFTQEELASAW